MRFKNSIWRTTPPNYDEIHELQEANERATIKAIVDGTCQARSWGDIQSTWGWVHKPKPRIIRVEKVKPKYVRPVKVPAMSSAGRQLYKILLSNGVSREEAKRMANELVGAK